MTISRRTVWAVLAACRALARALGAARRPIKPLFAAVLLSLASSAAMAHPHVWITMQSEVLYAPDGTVTGIESGFKPGAATVLGRIKLVNPPQENIVRGDDGLFRLKDGTTPDADANVALVGGALENSNVNVVDAMVDMISLARQFELQMSMLKNVESNDTKAAQIMSLS